MHEAGVSFLRGMRMEGRIRRCFIVTGHVRQRETVVGYRCALSTRWAKDVKD